MRGLFRCLYLVLQFKEQIMGAYAAFVVWTLARLIQTASSIKWSLRDRAGAFGLAAGAFSASLLASYYIFLAVENTLIAHGSALDVYFIVGSCAGAAGTIFALIGRGWVRRSALMISLVVVLQWYWMWAGGMGLDEIITCLTLLLLAAGGAILFSSGNLILPCQ